MLSNWNLTIRLEQVSHKYENYFLLIDFKAT